LGEKSVNSFPKPDSYDCIIIGSGAGGSAAAYRLASAGLRVALIEKGDALPRDSSTLDFDKVVRRGTFKSSEPWLDPRGRRFAPEEHFNVGGKTKWYGAALLRYGAHEFEGDATHGCLAWPFGYEALASHYDSVERLLGVRKFETEKDLARIIARLAKASPRWRAASLPLGLHASILENDLEARHFDGFASVAGLKGDAETAFLSRLRESSHLKLITGAPVTELLGDLNNPRQVRGVRLLDGRALFANAVLLGAGALHSPRLLQRYFERTGLMKQLPAAHHIGRNLKLHLLTAMLAVSSSTKTDLIRKTALFLNDDLPHSSVQPLGFDGELMSTLIPALVPRFVAREVGARAYGFFLQTEDASHPDNRVYDGARPDALPTLDYDAHRSPAALREHTQLVSQFRRALARAGMIAFSQRIGLAGTAHACGTLVTGTNSAHSVVDPHGQVHGMEGLYVVDGSVLPRSSRVNPSLTIYAWSTRVAQALAERLAERSSLSALRGIPA
jgi:choline dehydrogenase-like flavoprotein